MSLMLISHLPFIFSLNSRWRYLQKGILPLKKGNSLACGAAAVAYTDCLARGAGALGTPSACLPLYQALVTCMRTAHLSPVTQKKTSVIATRVQNLYKK